MSAIVEKLSEKSYNFASSTVSQGERQTEVTGLLTGLILRSYSACQSLLPAGVALGDLLSTEGCLSWDGLRAAITPARWAKDHDRSERTSNKDSGTAAILCVIEKNIGFAMVDLNARK